MQGIESAYCDVCVGALISAWRSLMEANGNEVLSQVKYGKIDTLGLDAIPEIIISERLSNFDNHSILITEELDEAIKRRWPSDSDPVKQPLMFFCDPTDRSKQLGIFFKEVTQFEPTKKIGELIKNIDCQKRWEEKFEAPAAITGSTSAITCVRKGAIIFSVILNYISQTIFVAMPKGTFQLKLPKYNESRLDQIDLSYIIKNGKPLTFPPAANACKKSDDYKRFVTFLGKSGYQENFNDSMIFLEKPDNYLHHIEPGGPSRSLYLSELQKGHGPIGFVLFNGEKIGEWIHSLAFVKFAKNNQGGQMLKVFEISIDRPWTKDGVLMSTSPAYSLFCNNIRQPFFDISRLRNFENPSKFRTMLVITQYDNERIIYIMREHMYREVTNSF